MCPLIENQDSAPKCHLTVALLSLYPFPSLISNSLNLPIFLCVCVFGHSSLTRDRTYDPCIGQWSLNHWATKEVPRKSWRLNEAYSCNQEMGYTERLLCPGAPEACLVSMGHTSPTCAIALQLLNVCNLAIAILGVSGLNKTKDNRN